MLLPSGPLKSRPSPVVEHFIMQGMGDDAGDTVVQELHGHRRELGGRVRPAPLVLRRKGIACEPPD